MWFELLVLTGALLTLYYYLLNSRAVKNLPPGPSPIFPVVGNLPQFIKFRNDKTYDIFNKLVALYGPVVFFKVGKISQVVVQDLTLAKEVLSSDVWVDRVMDDRYIFERSWGKQCGIIFASGEVWKEMRRFSMRTLRDFGFGRQKSMESVIEDEVSLLTEIMDGYATSKNKLSMRQFFTVSILNLLWSMVAGTRFSNDDLRLRRLIDLIDETAKNHPAKLEMIQAFPALWFIFKKSNKAKRRDIFFTEMHSFFREILKERRESGAYKDKGNAKDFIDVFLQEIDDKKNGPQKHLYNDEQFIMVCFDLLIAGAETTSNTLEFAMLYMILNPEIQAKVQKEIDTVVGSSRRPTLEDKSRMPYTEATILEIQRMANVLPVIVRRAAYDTSISGYHIPEGTLAGISTISLHNCRKTWTDPETFNPSRFLSPDGKCVINANKILPFGLGKRVCLGETLARASLFSYFSTVLQRYTLSVPNGHVTKPSTDPIYGFTLSPHEYFVTLMHR